MPAALIRQLDRLGIPSALGDRGPVVDMREKLILSRRESHRLVFDYLSLSIEKIVSSEEPFVRGFGMLDRWVGKRRAATLFEQERHPWPRLLLDLRCDVEGWCRIPPPPAASG